MALEAWGLTRLMVVRTKNRMVVWKDIWLFTTQDEVFFRRISFDRVFPRLPDQCSDIYISSDMISHMTHEALTNRYTISYHPCRMITRVKQMFVFCKEGRNSTNQPINAIGCVRSVWTICSLIIFLTEVTLWPIIADNESRTKLMICTGDNMSLLINEVQDW